MGHKWPLAAEASNRAGFWPAGEPASLPRAPARQRHAATEKQKFESTTFSFQESKPALSWSSWMRSTSAMRRERPAPMDRLGRGPGLDPAIQAVLARRMERRTRFLPGIGHNQLKSLDSRGRKWIWFSFGGIWISFHLAWNSLRPAWNSLRPAWNSLFAAREGQPRPVFGPGGKGAAGAVRDSRLDPRSAGEERDFQGDAKPGRKSLKLQRPAAKESLIGPWTKPLAR